MMKITLATTFILFGSLANAAEPSVPTEMNQPRTHIVELKQKAALRMGDSITLKASEFTAKLVGFREPLCAGPQPGCASAGPIPEFQLVQGAVTCEPDPKSRACHRKLSYEVITDRVTDRAAVTARIRNRRKR